MKSRINRSLLAASIAALVAIPAWADTATQAALTTPAEGASLPSGAPPRETTGSAPAAQPKPAPAASSDRATEAPSALVDLTPQELEGMQIFTFDRKKIGEIKSIVRRREAKAIQAVVEVGGFLGIGAKDVVVQLDSLHYVNGKVLISATEEELLAGEDYVPDEYIALKPDDQPISEFSAFEPSPESGSNGETQPHSQQGPAYGTSPAEENEPTPMPKGEQPR